MSGEFEDPRKTELRERCSDAVDAAGYTVDTDRTPIPYPADSGFKGAIKPDVSSVAADGTRLLHFVRVDGDKPLPGWLSNIVVASYAMDNLKVYVVAETPGEQLKKTSEAIGCGLLSISGSNELELELEYTAPDRDAERKAFEKRIRAVRRKLDTKLNANLESLQDDYSQRRQVTEGMNEATRAKYLTSIEQTMLRWREWSDDRSSELDALAGTTDQGTLDEIEKRIGKGPE